MATMASIMNPTNFDDQIQRNGPLSRTWPQLFKKRRRTSAVVTEYAGVRKSGVKTPPLKIPISKSPRESISGASDSSTSTHTTATYPTGKTQADLLAQKSNYEWIASGRHAEMGLHFSTAMATGVMMRRATHRAAEQARRDRMKSAMVDLAEFLLDGEVTFGSGTSCFVVSREDAAAEMANVDEDVGDGESFGVQGGDEKKRGRNINKARIIEMALEKLRAQEKEIASLKDKTGISDGRASPVSMDATQ